MVNKPLKKPSEGLVLKREVVARKPERIKLDPSDRATELLSSLLQKLGRRETEEVKLDEDHIIK